MTPVVNAPALICPYCGDPLGFDEELDRAQKSGVVICDACWQKSVDQERLVEAGQPRGAVVCHHGPGGAVGGAMSADFRAGQAVAVLVGSACPMHATVTPEILAALQGRYGRVMDSDQAEAWAGPSRSADHAIFVRYARPELTAAGLVRGGWYAAGEVLPIDEVMLTAGTARRDGRGG